MEWNLERVFKRSYSSVRDDKGILLYMIYLYVEFVNYKIPVPKDAVYTIKLRLILGVIKLLGVKVDLVIQYVFMFNTSETMALIHRYKNI